MAPDLYLVRDYLIDGEGLAVANPANGEEIARVRDYQADEVKEIIVDAKNAMPAWAAKTAKARAEILHAWRDGILNHVDALAAIVTAESGKPIGEAMAEVAYAASFIEWFAEEGKRAYGDVIPTYAEGRRILVLKQPVGVAAAITPWNFPIAMITRKAAPALAAGCPMVVKPAEATPLSALALEALARQAGLPADLFRIVTTREPETIGDAFCESPIIRKLSFTGSTRVGKILARKCAGTVKNISLELGGNAPFIVFDDADIDAAVYGAVAAKYRNAGQTCVCANRILVQDRVYDAFIAAFTDRVRALCVGDGSIETTQIGPLINEAAVEKVSRLLTDALAHGAEISVGGDNPRGNFLSPTVLTSVRADMAIAREEVFGPVASVIRFATEAEAVKIANDTPYGLAAYFYAKDMARIWRVMEALEYGMVGVNEGVISTEVAPFGGVKESGIGREGSRYGLDEYLETKYCLISGLI